LEVFLVAFLPPGWLGRPARRQLLRGFAAVTLYVPTALPNFSFHGVRSKWLLLHGIVAFDRAAVAAAVVTP